MPERITSLQELAKAREEKKSVHCPGLRCFAGPSPAAFVMNYTGDLLHRIIQSGLFIYTPKPKK